MTGKMEWFLKGIDEYSVVDKCGATLILQPSFTCSESTIEAPEQ